MKREITATMQWLSKEYMARVTSNSQIRIENFFGTSTPFYIYVENFAFYQYFLGLANILYLYFKKSNREKF